MKHSLIVVCLIIIALIGVGPNSSIAFAQSDLGWEAFDPGSNPPNPPPTQPPSTQYCSIGFLMFVAVPGGCL